MKLSVLALDYDGERTADVVVDIANAIRSRYDLADGGPV